MHAYLKQLFKTLSVPFKHLKKCRDSANVSAYSKKLISAAGFGDYYLVKYLLENHAAVNTQNVSGDTALILAAGEGHLEIVSLLIDYGADVNIQDEDGVNALILATFSGHLDIVDLLLNKTKTKTPVDIHMKSDAGDTALDYALEYGQVDIAELLKQAGAKPKAPVKENARQERKLEDFFYSFTPSADTHLLNNSTHAPYANYGRFSDSSRSVKRSANMSSFRKNP